MVYGLFEHGGQVHAQIRNVVIAHQQTFAFKKAANTMSDGVRQVSEFSTGRRLTYVIPLIVESKLCGLARTYTHGRAFAAGGIYAHVHGIG